MKKWFLLAILLIFVLGYRLLLRYLIKKLGSEQNSKHSAPYLNLGENAEKVYGKWVEAGNRRKPRKTIMKLPEQEPPLDETEYPNSLDELFEGLSDEEISMILDELTNDKQEKSDER